MNFFEFLYGEKVAEDKKSEYSEMKYYKSEQESTIPLGL